MGTSFFFKELSQFYYNNNIRSTSKSFVADLSSYTDSGNLVFSVSKYAFLTAEDNDAIMHYVEKGNTLFLSAEYIDTSLLNLFHLSQRDLDFYYYPYGIKKMSDAVLKIKPIEKKDTSQYSYFFYPFNNYFVKMEPISTYELGFNSNGLPDCLVLYIGAGRLYLHSEPRAFSNYFLRTGSNYHYIEQLLAYTNVVPTHVKVNEYYNHRTDRPNGHSGSTLSVLMKYPSLAWALGIFAALLCLYVLFGGKRRQRIVREIPPVKNTTLAFVETVGRLYLQHKDNRNVAEKAITYFMEHIRNQYFLNTSHINEDFLATLSRKSGIERKETNQLFDLINKVQSGHTVSDMELLYLNKSIENFYKNRK